MHVNILTDSGQEFVPIMDNAIAERSMVCEYNIFLYFTLVDINFACRQW